MLRAIGMNAVLFTFGSTPITPMHLLAAAGAAVLLMLLLLLRALATANRERSIEAHYQTERQRELDDKLAQLNALQSELSGRLAGMHEMVGAQQERLTRAVAERLDAVRSSLGQGLEQNVQRTVEGLSKLNERLAVIDSAQTRLTDLTSEVLVLKDILANKQARGAFGQGRMEAIIRDQLPPSAFAFQYTLANRSRPDCVLFLPGDERPLAIDAKFPLEAFAAAREAGTDEARAAADRRIRSDVGVHLKDVADKYIVQGVTQEIALLFVPSEALYAEICERFDDLVQKGHRARVIIVSPSLLLMAVQLCRAIVRDAEMQKQAQVIQKEVGVLLEDVRRLAERAGKLTTHFQQAQDDVAGIGTSADKVMRRGERIKALEFGEAGESRRSVPQGVSPTLAFEPRAAE